MVKGLLGGSLRSLGSLGTLGTLGSLGSLGGGRVFKVFKVFKVFRVFRDLRDPNDLIPLIFPHPLIPNFFAGVSSPTFVPRSPLFQGNPSLSVGVV